ncbi:recombinase family protein [Streptomyces sp. NPDC087850]|uniref:recombinase family protein n=1 Tax=Streptomyces sp. NPDC087850 TaxID=3365809 RepID=UPI0038102083
MSKALIYTRSATGAGLEAQEAACRAYCEQKGYEVVQVRRETGISDVVDRALKDIESGSQFDILLSEDLTIYSRSAPRVLSLVNQASERGIRVFTADGTELTSAEEKWKISMMATLTSLEESRIAERHEAMREHGYAEVIVELTDSEIDSLERKLKDDPDTAAVWAKLKDSIDAFKSETAPEFKRCADCGKKLPEGSKRTECKHCEKCIDFECMATHREVQERAESRAANDDSPEL